MKKLLVILSLVLAVWPASRLWAKLEREQMQIENQLQQRIEGILSKTLPPNSYIVSVKVEMETSEREISRKSTTAKRSNALLGRNQYVLPGVPQKKEFAVPEESFDESNVSGFSAETLVKRIQVSILLSPDITGEQIRAIRDVISTSIPFNPLRGDEMDIQNSPLLKSASSAGTLAGGAAVGGKGTGNIWNTLKNRTDIPVLVMLGAVMMLFVLFIGFLFGPVRAFLNRLLAVLPRIGEQAAYTVSNAPSKNGAVNGAGPNGFGSNGNGHDDEDKGTRPFRFIREDQLTKLPILFKSMSPAQCAVILAYLPAEWASKILGTLDQGIQTTIMSELAQAREVPPEIVQELEENIKNKLPYLVGGEEWVSSVYQYTQPQTQKALLGTINQQSPELAQRLRHKTFFMEDLGVITPGALRLLFQEVSYPVAALSLRDEKPEMRDTLLKRLPVAMREILQQEMDLAGDDGTAIEDAKRRLLDVGRKLLSEGRMTLPEGRGK